jgi:hypothetical protein
LRQVLKPLLLGCLVTLPLVGTASAQSNWRDARREQRKELRREMKENRKEYREALRNGDWYRAQEQYRELQQSRYNNRYSPNTYNYAGRPNNGYYYPGQQYNQYQWNTTPYYQSYPVYPNYYPYR